MSNSHWIKLLCHCMWRAECNLLSESFAYVAEAMPFAAKNKMKTAVFRGCNGQDSTTVAMDICAILTRRVIVYNRFNVQQCPATANMYWRRTPQFTKMLANCGFTILCAFDIMAKIRFKFEPKFSENVSVDFSKQRGYLCTAARLFRIK